MAFKQKGWSGFTQKKEYEPQTKYRGYKGSTHTDITPQTKLHKMDKDELEGHIEGKFDNEYKEALDSGDKARIKRAEDQMLRYKKELKSKGEKYTHVDMTDFGKKKKSALKQKKKKFKDTKTSVAATPGSIVVTKGARTNVGDAGGNENAVAGEKGKRKIYSPVIGKDDKKNVWKEVLTKKKGEASGAETWEHKKGKFITDKKALRQTTRAAKQQTRQQKRQQKKKRNINIGSGKSGLE